MKKSSPVVELKPEHPKPSPESKEIVVKVEPVINVKVPATDMAPIAEAISKVMANKSAEPNVDVHVHERERKPKRINIEVERDGRGLIKNLICTEITDG